MGALMVPLPYCGSSPLPGELLFRFNFDPRVISALVICCVAQWLALRKAGSRQRQHALLALSGWIIAAVAFLSPLCALSVALFSARIAQHMVLVLAAAPLIALGLPRAQSSNPGWLWISAALFFLALWYWHMPRPYEATFTTVWIYWTMHLTLFGSAILLWRELLNHPPQQTAQVLLAGILTFVHMGLLGAVLTFADRPLFMSHLLTTRAWGLTPLQDQELGGVLMWVPGLALFLWTAVRSLGRLWESLERARPA
jgi:putative membrane protein